MDKWRLGIAGIWLIGTAVAPGCGPGTQASPHDGGTDAPTAVCQDSPGQIVCDGNTAITCDAAGEETGREVCPSLCQTGIGCAVCIPNEHQCAGGTSMVCSDDQQGWEPDQVCDPNLGQSCDQDSGRCISLCDQAAEDKANVGCDYVAVDMVNWPGYGDENCFVVIVSNVQPEGTATVTVEDEDGVVLDFPGYGTERQVPAGDLAVLVLTGTAGMCSDTPARPNVQTITSGLKSGTVFRVKSTLPVVAYQINPYEAATAFSTDASLLIPVPALDQQYMVASYPGDPTSAPGTVSVIALEDDTDVTFTPTVALRAGAPVPASGPFTVNLTALDHLQILATDGDLTSSLVSATKPVAVFSGTLCATIPVGTACCDHIEEQMPPLRSWGWTYLAAMPAQRGTEKAYWRIVAALDGTSVTFDPLSSYNTVLNAGEFLEIDTDQSFLVSSAANPAEPDPDTDPPILVAHYLKGSQQTATESGEIFGNMGNRGGDPAMGLSVPVEQYLDQYIFFADPTYAYNYVVVVRTDPTAPIHLDCFDPIPDARFLTITGDYGRAVINLTNEAGATDGTCTSGVHRIWSDSPFGIWVYGYYECTSYAYPGGMNLQQINDVIVD